MRALFDHTTRKVLIFSINMHEHTFSDFVMYSPLPSQIRTIAILNAILITPINVASKNTIINACVDEIASTFYRSSKLISL